MPKTKVKFEKKASTFGANQRIFVLSPESFASMGIGFCGVKLRIQKSYKHTKGAVPDDGVQAQFKLGSLKLLYGHPPADFWDFIVSHSCHRISFFPPT
jgi:hypothetical protein